MHYKNHAFIGLALLAALFLSGCQSTITSIQLPDPQQVSWRAFMTGFNHESDTLSISTSGNHIAAELNPAGGPLLACGNPDTGEHLFSDTAPCPTGFTYYDSFYHYQIAVEIGDAFKSGAIHLADGSTTVRSIPITTGSGGQITIHYGIDEGRIPLPYELEASPDDYAQPYISDNFTFVVMFPPDPNFRAHGAISSLDPEEGLEQAEAWLESASSGTLCLSMRESVEDILEGGDMILFNTANGNGIARCSVGAPQAIPSSSPWLQMMMVLAISAFGLLYLRRRVR